MPTNRDRRAVVVALFDIVIDRGTNTSETFRIEPQCFRICA
ncbi:MAG: hypothetical protein ACU85U_09295 [Gammaproteobacteria bacterium]